MMTSLQLVTAQASEQSSCNCHRRQVRLYLANAYTKHEQEQQQLLLQAAIVTDARSDYILQMHNQSRNIVGFANGNRRKDKIMKKIRLCTAVFIQGEHSSGATPPWGAGGRAGHQTISVNWRFGGSFFTQSVRHSLHIIQAAI